MSNNCVKAVKNQDRSTYELVANIYKGIVRKCNYAIRRLNKDDSLIDKQAEYSSVVNKIVEIANLIRHFCKHYYIEDFSKESLQCLQNVHEIIISLQIAFFNPSCRSEYYDKIDRFKTVYKDADVPKKIKENLFNIRENCTFLIKEVLYDLEGRWHKIPVGEE